MTHNNQAYSALATSEGDIPLFPPNYDDSELHNSHSRAGHSSNSHQNNNSQTHYNNDPNANDVNDDINLLNTPAPPMEQFEMEEDFDEDPVQREGLLVRASLMTKKFASNFNNSFIHPVSKMIDPIYEGYKYLQLQYEKSILKLGNPLVVKRLLYVFFIMSIIFFITRYNINDGINGSSGGAFSAGKFYDIDVLGEVVKDIVDRKLMKENLEYFSSMPHITGSRGDLTLAKYIETYMANNGITIIDFSELQSSTNYPVSNEKETYVKLSDDSFGARLYEMENKDMEYLAYNPNALNTISDKPLEGKYIYCNYGLPEDFKKLQDNGISIADAIILIKYGGPMPEPNKVHYAQENKAKAIIFLSPKIEFGADGSKAEHSDVIQKFNVGLTRISPGDVLTPGWSSEGGYVTRLPWFKSQTTPKIPTIPISWKDSEVFLSKLKDTGVQFDDGFFSGDGSNAPSIKMKISNEERANHQIWNIVGSIQGREQAEKGIIIGSSRDSACFGTQSANTGTIVMLELVKVFTSLQRKFNWSPSRSIYFISFDATEYNLAGSTEWIENRKESLKKEGYTYIDLSDAVTGDDLSIKANPFLHEVIKNALRKVQSDVSKRDDNNENNDDRKKISLYDLYKKQNKGKDDISNELIESKNYIPFINLANVPSMEIKYSGKKYPRNSCYDNFETFENSQIDPNMDKHHQLVEVLSLVTLDLAETPIIPYNFNDMQFRLGQYARDLSDYANEIAQKLNQPNKPQMHFESLFSAIDVLKISGARFQDFSNSWKQYVIGSADIEPSVLAMNRWKWNDNMLQFNQKFILRDVHPRRPGFVNILFGVPYLAPENSDGKHQWNSFPSIRDYLSQGDFGRAQHEINLLANLISQAAHEFLDL
ncbi:uncharacterized protein RJT20DRAFT_33464 [Scheffersomyces xylosifermentans]|uniref:uncharacterized protein n=1 Tax=Scheffersomyces xylosifermentans TaxID=1304137 RepID=UPI00315D23FE